MATLFVATSAQATWERNFYQTHPTVSLNALQTEALTKALSNEHYRVAYHQEKKFQQNIQLAVLASSGIVAATFLGCVFAEWLQEFKVRKAEKARLIARLNAEAREVRTACYAN